jgi:hypothetical protein
MSKVYRDPCSFSSSQHFRLNHVDFDWIVDFEQQTLEGSAKLSFNINSNASDANSIVNIISVVRSKIICLF